MSKRRIEQPRCVECGRFRAWEDLGRAGYDPESGPYWRCLDGKGCRREAPALRTVARRRPDELKDYRR